MPIVVIHQTAADQLGPAANVGRYATDQQNFRDSLALQQAQDERDFRQQTLDQQAADNAGRLALHAADAVDRRRHQDEQLQQQQDTQGLIGSREQAKQDRIDARTATTQGSIGTREQAKQGAIGWREQAKQDRIDAREAAKQASVTDRAQGIQDRIDERQDSGNQFKAAATAVAQDFKQHLADQRGVVKVASITNAANRADWNRQKLGFDQRLHALNDQIQQLQKLQTTSTDKALPDRISALIQNYQDTATEYEKWLRKPQSFSSATQPGAPDAGSQPSTQPTTAPAAPLTGINRQTGQRIRWNGSAWELIQ